MNDIHTAPPAYAQALTDVERPSVPVDPLADYVIRLKLINTRIKGLQAEADGIKAAIQDALGDAEVGTVHGLPVVTWSHHVRHAFDQTAFRKAEPGIHAAYLKATTVRRFTVIEENPE